MIPGEPPIKSWKVAVLLGVSVRFIRNSDCPKHRYVGNGPKRRTLIVYYASEVLAWWKAREVGGPLDQDSPLTR